MSNPDHDTEASPGEGNAPAHAGETSAAGEATTATSETAPGEATDLAARYQAALDDAAQQKDLWLRAKAETENVRRQAQSDIAKAYKFAIERFAENLLGVKDSLESTLAAENATLETLKSGVELTLKQLRVAFDKAQITEIMPQGEKFDPHRHQAISMIESDKPPNTVVQVLQKGYALNERVLRPALVLVAKAPAGDDRSA